MKKRVASAILWFYAGWYGGTFVVEYLHVSPLIGPIIGAVLAALIAGDPRHLIWKAADAVTLSSGTDTTQETA